MQAAASADGTKLVPEKRYEIAIKVLKQRRVGDFGLTARCCCCCCCSDGRCSRRCADVCLCRLLVCGSVVVGLSGPTTSVAAGTSANVFIVLHGALGDSGERVVDGNFQRGATDTVSVVCADLGALSKIRIG